jgi:hypothetical protein
VGRRIRERRVVMTIEMRKARAKVLKRILNSLSVEINELKTRGESDVEDLESARNLIIKFCDKLWPLSIDSAMIRYASYAPRQRKQLSESLRHAA